MQTHTDQEWIRQLKQEDSQAIHDLWELLFTYSVRVARHYQQDDDIGYDAAVIAYRKIRTRGVNQYQFKSSFPAYCRTILVNEVRRLLKRRKDPTSEMSDDLAAEADTSQPINSGQIRAKISPCLERLTQRTRQVIDLLYFEQLSPEVAASQLGISRNYVNVLAHRARLDLKECLEQHGYLSTDDVL